MKTIKQLINWNDISIFKKIGLGSGIVILFLVGISFQSVSGISGILQDAKEVIYGNSLDAIITQREMDHLNWANRISKLLSGSDPATLDIKTDHRDCSFGQWLYSDARTEAERIAPGLTPLLKKIEAPHQQMHASAATIKETLKPNHNGLDLVLADFKSGHAAWVSKLGEAIAEEAGGLFVYQSLIRTAIQQAVSQIQAIDERTELTLNERKALAYENLKSMKYGDGGLGYFFILDDQVNILMHPHKPEMEGQNHQLTADKHGSLFFNEMVAVAKAEGNGFVTYYWNLPGKEEVAPKLAYVYLYKPWNWIVGTGIYVDHTNKRLQERVEGFAVGEPFSLGIETDPAQCPFGQFARDKETLKLMEAFPEFKKAMTEVQEVHTRLHSHGAEIENAISDLNMRTAIKTFQNQIQEDLSEFNRILTTAIEAEQALVRTRKAAEEIYTQTTLPALIETQRIQEEIKDTARKYIKTSDAILDRAQSVRSGILTFSAAAILAGVLLSLFIAKSIRRPLLRSVEFVKSVANGDLTGKIDISQKDEIGVLCDAMNQMSENLNTMFLDVSQSVHTLTSSATELSTISEQISGSSRQTADKSTAVSAAAVRMDENMGGVAAATEQAAANIRTVVAAVEQMAATINNIAENTARGSRTTAMAVENATLVSGKVDELGKAATEISKVTDTIADISEQTNLLALNATIEAARAGEAGKGFAVVANEIKDLALQTAAATGEINTRIGNVQETTRESIQVIAEIVKIIGDVDGIVSSVAAAIEEQTSGTREISDNISQAALGLDEVSGNVGQTSIIAGEVSRDIGEVSQATEEMDSGSGQIKSSAGELSILAEGLNQMVRRFKIRA